MASLAAAAAFLYPAAASAEGFSGGLGTYVSFTFGEIVGVGYGLEGFFTGVLQGDADGCFTTAPRAGMGGMAQIGGINGEQVRVVTAMYGGGELDEKGGHALAGEFGVAFHTVEEVELGMHTGLLYQSPVVLLAFSRAEWWLDEYSVGGGARYLPTFGSYGGESMCGVLGRPCRDDQGRVALDRPHRFACEDPGADPLVMAVADEWAQDAQAECASVPAFLNLARDLLANGAPDALVDAALDAARDEIHHARLCAELASRGSTRVWPRLPSLAPRPTRTGREGMVRLAVESWLDGCLAEGVAARRAHAASLTATDPEVRAAQRRIARDEERHADLGWRVLTWALETGGTEVADAVLRHRDAEDVLALRSLLSPAEARAHGRAGRRTGASLSAEVGESARRRVDTLLGSAL